MGKFMQKYPSLTYINFSRNHFKEIKALSHVDNLLYLNASYNVLESLPNFPQTHFQVMDVSHNRLANLKKAGSETLESINLDCIY